MGGTGAVILLAVAGAVFALWAFVAFRALFRLHGWAVRREGRAFFGPARVLAAFRSFATEPEFARDRRQLALASLALAAALAMVLLFARG